MLEKKVGKQTSRMQNPPSINAAASIVGPKEGKGPLADYFDQAVDDEFWGENSWEKAESKFMREVLAKVTAKASLAMDALDFVIAGDLLNQCIAASFGIRESNLPFFGIYGACSTIGEAMRLGGPDREDSPSMWHASRRAISARPRNSSGFRWNWDPRDFRHSGQ